uniref:Halovibrin HvnA n=1 Tax=Pseudomonas graminis TaxID=158627 RepID=A0A7C2AYV9_9PSED
MKLFVLLLSIAVFSGCSSQTPPPQKSSVNAVDGPAVAAAIQANYLDTRRNCGSESMPAFLCSGVLFRGTNESASYHSWNPVPGRTGVSFSYLRKDANFDHLAVGTDNGFILYPILESPTGKDHLQVLCSFPIDGYTWVRAQPGCGESTQYPGVSARCQSQGISTATQWKAHFDKGPSGANQNDVYAYVCSFDVRDQMNQLAAESFYQSLQAMHLVPVSLPHHYNELVLQAWAQNIPTRLPIQAFFYTDASGLKGARHDQWDFFRSTSGTFIPIIHMALPAAVTGNASFTYAPADQYCQPGATSCL